MGLELSIKIGKRDGMLTCAAIAIAIECYTDLQTGYGILLRKENLLNRKRALELIKAFVGLISIGSALISSSIFKSSSMLLVSIITEAFLL